MVSEELNIRLPSLVIASVFNGLFLSTLAIFMNDVIHREFELFKRSVCKLLRAFVPDKDFLANKFAFDGLQNV